MDVFTHNEVEKPHRGLTVSFSNLDDDKEGNSLVPTAGDDQGQPTYGSVEQEEAEEEDAEMVLKRMLLHASVLDTYAICSALLTGFCVCTIFINHDDVGHSLRSDPLRYFALLTHQVIVRLCTAMGVYAMLVFMLTALYSKTALAREHYSRSLFAYIKISTARSQTTAFYAMYYSCIIYAVSIACSLFYSVPGILAEVSALLVLAILASLVWESRKMMDIAGTFSLAEDAMLQKLKKAGYTCKPQP